MKDLRRQPIRILFLTVFLIAAITNGPLLHADSSAAHTKKARPDVSERARKLHALFGEEWEYELRTNPERATAFGDNRYNGRLSDYSPRFYYSDVRAKRKFLARFNAIDPTGLSSQDVLSRTLMLRKLRDEIAAAQFKPWEMPVNQMDGPQLWFPDLATLAPFRSVLDYENYLSRLHQIPRVFGQVMINMRAGMQDRLMPPRYLLEKVVAQAEQIANATGEASPFAKPVKEFPATIMPADRKRLRAAVIAAINNEVTPSYHRFAEFVRTDYAPHGRSEPGIWSLPDGKARYRFAIRSFTTTDLSPEEIHTIGLNELAKIEAEETVLARKLGFKDVASLTSHIRNERKLHATSGQQLLELYTQYVRQMEPELPKLFGQLPRNSLAVVPMDNLRAPSAVPADYTPGAEDGSRPGRINVNQWDPERRSLLNVEAIAYHEGIPGHHLQISLSQELHDLPSFRRHAEYTAFVEGWALYSERLAKEIGFYQDPYNDYGRLENEAWRAIRLVVDTGVHEKRWTRQEMVDFFHRHTAMDERTIQTEVDRYIAWPGQSLAYEIGELEILKLRAEARQNLGDKFDLAAFHDVVLDSGAVPLDVLETQVRTWIAGQSSKESRN